MPAYIYKYHIYIYTHYILIAMPPCRHHICFDFSVCAGGGRYMRLCRAKWQLGMYYKIYIICIYVYLSFHCWPNYIINIAREIPSVHVFWPCSSIYIYIFILRHMLLYVYKVYIQNSISLKKLYSTNIHAPFLCIWINHMWKSLNPRPSGLGFRG